MFCQWNGTPYHPERFSREFDRKREEGRPFNNNFRRFASEAKTEIVRQIQREQNCTLRRAIELAAPLLQLDAAAAHRLWKRLTR